MSEIAKAVFSILNAATTVTDLVSNRITPEARTQGAALPCVVYSISSDESESALSGAGFRKAQIEVMCVAMTAAGASALHDAVRTSLHRINGTFAGVVVHHSLHSKSLSQYQAPAAGESTGAFLQSAIFSVMYSE